MAKQKLADFPLSKKNPTFYHNILEEMAIRQSVFNKFLKSMTEEDLRSEMEILFSKYQEVKEHYTMELGSEKDRKKVFDNAKKDIAAKYKTRSFRRPKRPRISKVKTILRELDKVSVFKEEMADMYLYNCEVSLDFMDDYCFYSEVLFNNVNTSFTKAIELIIASMSEHMYLDRCQVIVQKAYFASHALGKAMDEQYGNIIK